MFGIRNFVIGFVFAALLAAVDASQAQYIAVSADAVNIRTEPRTTAEIVVQTKSGDIFDLKATRGDWFEIAMFSGEYRYLHRSLAQATTEAPPLPADQSVRRNACLEIVKAQDRAVSEAERRFSSDFDRQIDLERLLYDRYELPIFREYQIAPAHNATLVMECANNHWIR